MKKITLLAVVAALMLALVGGTAVAKKGSDNDNSGPGSGNSGKKTVTYGFFGTVTAVTPAGTVDPVTGVATTSDTVTVDVKKGNRAARDFVEANGDSQVFNVDSNTKVDVDENEDATLADVQVGDEVKVQVKAAPTATAPLTARQLQVKNEDDDTSLSS